MIPKINWRPNATELRKFGVVILIGFGLIGALLFWKGRVPTAYWIWAVSGAIGLIAIVLPPLSLPFYWIWMGFAFVMGQIMSRVLIALIFFGILTPIAIVMRMMGRDSLRRLKPSANVASYWIEHPEIEKENYKHLF